MDQAVRTSQFTAAKPGDRMSVVVFVSQCQTAVLQKALSNHYRIIAAECWGVLETAIRSEPVCAVILDPTRDECGDVMQAERLIKKYSTLPFIAYVGVNAHSVKAVARLARVGLQDVFLLGHDDSPEYIKERVDAVSSSALASVFLAELRPFLNPLPPGTANAVEDLFEMPHRYSGAHDLAKAAAVTMSGLYRSFRAARLSSPKKFLIGARVLRGYKYLLEPEFSVENVAAKAYYTSPRAFVRHIRQVFGLCPSSLRSALSCDQVLSQLLEWLIDNQVSELPPAKPRNRLDVFSPDAHAVA